MNGIVTAGSSIFTVLLPFFLRILIDNMGLFYTLRVLCIFMFVLFLAGFTYRPLATSVKEKDSGTKGGHRFPLFSRKFRPPEKIFNFAIFKVTAYTVWAVGIPLALFGYFVPYVHLVSMLPFLCWQPILFYTGKLLRRARWIRLNLVLNIMLAAIQGLLKFKASRQGQHIHQIIK